MTYQEMKDALDMAGDAAARLEMVMDFGAHCLLYTSDAADDNVRV